MTADGAREVLAVRYGHRVTTRAESYLNVHLYGEPDAAIDIDYYFWVIRDGGQLIVAGHDPLVRQRFAAHPAGQDVTDVGAPLAG